jgi:hypothetical protein
MIDFQFGPEDVARVRFAFSPGWELAASIRVLRDPSAHALHVPWVEEARAALVGVDLAMLAALIPREGYVPDFFDPPPDTPLPEFSDELAAVRRVAPSVVAKELGILFRRRRIPRVVQPLLDDPRRGLRELTDLMAVYWDRALAPHWDRIRALLQGEVMHRARQLTVGGAEMLFADIHENVRWEAPSLFVEMRHEAVVPLDGRGLLMVPSVFHLPRLAAVTDPAWQPSLTYAPRGVATLWDPAQATGPEGLAALLGGTRAALIAELETPRSTTELARRLDVTAGAVSQHLGKLRGAGVVNASREGREVLYVLTPAGEALLSAARPPRA